MQEALYDKQIRERKEAGLSFICPPILNEGINRYQMTCNDCPTHVRKLCHEETNKKKQEADRMTFVKVKINNDGKYCDTCQHLEYDDVNKKNCCMLFGEFVESIGEKPYYSDTKDIRCNKCIEAELAIGGNL